MNKNPITVETVVNISPNEAWNYLKEPEHIVGWVFAADTSEVPYAGNNLCVGGKSKTSMAAKDQSTSTYAESRKG